MSKPKVMVAIRDAEHVESLMELACGMAAGLGAELTALHVVEVGPGLPLDAPLEVLDEPGRTILSRATQIAAAKFHTPISTRLVRGREAGVSILAESEDQAVDLLVLGYHKKNPLSNWILGSTVENVARHAPCRVIVQIPKSNGTS